VSVTETVADQLEDVSSLSPEIADSLKQIREAIILIEESARSLKSLSERMVFDENLCNEVQERLEQIKKICRKYGPSEDDVLRAAEELKQKTALLEKLEENTVQLEREVQGGLKKLDSAALELSASRAASGKKLSAKVLHELQELGMKEARFAAEVSFRKRGEADSENPLEMWSTSGADALEFLISPNPGEQLKPLRKIASGGELSRTMLGLMGILADVEGVPVLVFDEVDANIGGRLGTIIGEKLARLAQRRQILCITHLPQIAVYGAKHFRVVKNVRKGSTFTEVEPLSQEDRIQELSEMLRGEKASQTTVEQVLEMLSDAQKWHGISPSAKPRK
jgi:DNA repair protein RecN (Recombination protein N)